ncbi:MAG: ATP-binding protein [Peptococcaceae bacterium]
MKKNERVPLLRYWTTRYLLTLCVGLIIIGIIASLWIRYSTTQKRLDSIKSFAEEIAASTIDSEGNFIVDSYLSRMIEIRQRFLRLERNFILFIVDRNGNLLYSKPAVPSIELLEKISIPPDVMQGVQRLTSAPGVEIFVIKQGIEVEGFMIGNVYIIYPVREIVRSTEEIQLLAIMLSGLAILGWLIIYLLTKKLSKPIKDVVKAANQIVEGDYNIRIDKNIKEQEIFDLTYSFKKMAERLQQLEAMRTELLAGVTHELKTPITAISGLIQAVRDGVVTGEEADDFLEICNKETTRLHKMVEDLLDFNSFLTGDIHVHKELYDINQLVLEITHQWSIGQENNDVVLNTRLPDQTFSLETDSMRIQQILYNLFNNAKQSFHNGGVIDLFLYEHGQEIRIDVKDNGTGISAAEQGLIFERFFRGKAKKDRIRGLGLGLPFSRMIANALGGDLWLAASSPQGTTFTLSLPKE